MAQFIDGNVKAFECDEALAIHRCVKMDADGKVTYADAADDYHGTAEQATFAAGEIVSVRLRSASGTRKMVASAAITAGAPVFNANDGKVAPSGNNAIGYALEAASGDGSVIEVLTIDVPDTWVPSATFQSLSGAGAINVTTYLTKWTTTGANAGTLANGTRPGQLKKVLQIVDGGVGTLTPTSLSGGTSIAFEDVGDYVILKWNGAAWVVIESGNDADGTSAPTVS